MENESRGFGLNQSKNGEHADYIGKAGTFSNQFASVTGVYIGTQRDSFGVDYAIFNPSVIYSSDGLMMIDSSSLPTKLIMPLIAMRPISGSLDEWIIGYNTQKKEDLSRSKL